MPNLPPLPKFKDDLADFVTELRAKTFATKLEAARYFNLSRPTVSRYEGGQIIPPLGYLVDLARLYLQQLETEGHSAIKAYQQAMMQEVNRVLRWHYREKEPFQKLFQSWDELEQRATLYAIERQKDKPLQISTDLALPATTFEDSSASTHEDWGEALDIRSFYGREAELVTLAGWLVNEHCRLVGLLGLGGMGKTTLSVKLVEQLKSHFEFVIWRSLRNAPPLEEILTDWLKVLSRQQISHLPETLNDKILLLLEYLRKARCLLVLDNFESILQEGIEQGDYAQGHQGYGEVLRRIGGTSHQSCLLLTSREKPGEFEALEGQTSPVRTLTLTGLTETAAQKILEDRELFGSAEAFKELINRYSSNPLALKLVAGTILELFGGEVIAFLDEGQAIFGGIGKLLDQQFERLSPLEQTVMYWLTIGREFVPLTRLQTDITPAVPKKELLEALKALASRSLIERSEAGASFSQQPVVMEYITGKIVEQVSQQLMNSEIGFLSGYALLKANGKDYIRAAQTRLFLKPVLDRLSSRFENEAALEQHFQTLLLLLRKMSRLEQGYSGGNLATLLYQLKGHLNGYNFSDLNLWQVYLQGVTLQNSCFARADLSHSVFTAAFDAICSLDLSSDGKFLVIGTAGGEVLIWQLAQGKLILNYPAHAGLVQAVAFSPDATRLATGGSDHRVKLWNVSDGICLKTLEGHTEWVWSVAFTPDGKTLVSGSSDHTIRLWDVLSGSGLGIIQAHNNSVRTLALSQNGTLLASGSGDKTIRLWDMTTRNKDEPALATLVGHKGWVQFVAFSQDGKRLASGSEDGEIKLWEVATGLCLNTLQGHSEWVWSVAFNQDGTLLASGSSDHTIKIWDVGSGQCLNTLQGHSGLVRAVAFAPEGKTLISGGGDRAVKFWEFRQGQSFKTWQGYSNPVRSIAFSPDGTRLVSSSGDRTMQLWEMPGGKFLKSWSGHHEVIWSIAFAPDGKSFVTGSDEKTVKLWQLDSGQCIGIFEGHHEWVQSVAFSPNGKLLASAGGDKSVRIWDARPGNGRQLQILAGHSEWVWSVAFSPDGTLLASGSNDQTVKLWNVASGQCLQTLGHGGGVLAVAFSPDGTKLVSAGGHNLKLWEVATGQSLHILEGHLRQVWAIAFSSDGKLLASGGEDGIIKLWDMADRVGQCLKTWQGQPEWVRSLAFSPDNNLLTSSGEDGTIRLWPKPFDQSQTILRSARPYENLDLSGVTGLTPAQKSSLKALGAWERLDLTSQPLPYEGGSVIN